MSTNLYRSSCFITLSSSSFLFGLVNVVFTRGFDTTCFSSVEKFLVNKKGKFNLLLISFFFYLQSTCFDNVGEILCIADKWRCECFSCRFRKNFPKKNISQKHFVFFIFFFAEKGVCGKLFSYFIEKKKKNEVFFSQKSYSFLINEENEFLLFLDVK